MIKETFGLEKSSLSTLITDVFDKLKEKEISDGKAFIEKTIAEFFKNSTSVTFENNPLNRNDDEKSLWRVPVKIPPFDISEAFRTSLIRSFGEKTLNDDETMVVQIKLEYDLRTAFVYLTPVE